MLNSHKSFKEKRSKVTDRVLELVPYTLSDREFWINHWIIFNGIYIDDHDTLQKCVKNRCKYIPAVMKESILLKKKIRLKSLFRVILNNNYFIIKKDRS